MQKIMDLSGDWDFGYTPDFRPVGELPPAQPDIFETAMPLPGYWDDHKDRLGPCNFYGRDARFNPDYRPMEFPMGQVAPDASTPFLLGVGWYRREVFIPDEYALGLFELRIGPCVMNAAVWCNRTRLAAHIGYSTGFAVDLSSAILPGRLNEIIIAVSNTANDRRGCAIRGYQGRRGGIGGGIELKISGSNAIRDTHLTAGPERSTWHVELHRAPKPGTVLEWRLGDSRGAVTPDKKDFIFSPDLPELEEWNEHSPHLYRLELILKQEDELLDRLERSWGCRRPSVRGTKLLLNGRPVFLRGSTEHFNFPLTANAHWNVAEYRSNIRKLKAVGFNWLRFHTWCPPEPYLDAADAEGMMIQIEVPRFSQSGEWEDIVRLIRRHPSAIILCGGNEDLIDESRIEELHRLYALCRRLSPDLLFNPQEGLRGVEYGEADTMGHTVETPFPHNPDRLAALAGFSDVYGAYSAGMLSYFTGDFECPEELDRNLKIYGKPCLSHEVGILGNYLNLDLEHRYDGTYIGPGLYSAVRKHLADVGLLDKAALYYRNSCRITASIRKHTLENARRCRLLAGYDFLGGCDAHWHRCGYPCGILNEFYELKPGASERDILAYNGENVLLLDVGCLRNLKEGERFSRTLRASCWGKESPLTGGRLEWNLRSSGGAVLRSGELASPPLDSGEVTALGVIEFTLPKVSEPVETTLECRFSSGTAILENEWNFWVFPDVVTPTRCAEPSGVLETDELTPRELEMLSRGDSVLLTGHFPTDTVEATFQPTQSGRVGGDLATIIGEHPALNRFPHRGFCDWQFYSLLKNSRAMLFDHTELPFAPLIEMVSSFKHARPKAMLCEYRVGPGRLMLASLNLRNSDPAAATLRQILLDYLGNDRSYAAPEIAPELLRELIVRQKKCLSMTKTDLAVDPNA